MHHNRTGRRPVMFVTQYATLPDVAETRNDTLRDT